MNGAPHIGHIRGRIMKDVWYRFSVLKGLNVVFRAGWDTQGLPVELQAEKELGLTGSKAENLEIVGEEKIVEACKGLIGKYNALWRESDRLLGMSMDYEKAYWTFRDEYIEREWKYLEQAWKKGLMGEGFRVVPYCPSCQCSLSHAEVGQGYETVSDPSLYYKVKVSGEDDRYLVLWTTMPFTVVTDEMVGVKPGETVVGVHRHAVAVLGLQTRQAAFQPIGKGVAHRHELGVRVGIQRVSGGAGPATATTDQADLQRAVFGGMGAAADAERAGQGPAQGGAGGLEEVAAGRLRGCGILGLRHGWLLQTDGGKAQCVRRSLLRECNQTKAGTYGAHDNRPS